MAVHALHRGGNEGVTAKVGLAGALGACVQLGKMDELTERGHLTAHGRVLEVPVSTATWQGIGHDLSNVFDFLPPTARRSMNPLSSSSRRGPRGRH